MKVCNSVGVWLFLIGVAFGATPIQDLKLIDSANGNKVAFTNLGSVSVGSGTTVTTISSNLITVSGNIMPGASNTYDIGSSNVPFRHGYFGTNSLYLGPYLMGVNSNGSLTYNGYPFVSTGGVSIAAQDGVITGGQNNVRLGTNVTTTGNVIVGGGLRQTAEGIVFSDTATDNMGLESVLKPVSGQTFSAWLGYFALGNSSGIENSAMGYLAGFNSPGNYQSALGSYALAYSAGSYNIAIGSDALRGAPGNYNIAMGYFAGYFAGGESNTFLGYQAARSAGNITNAIAIGANSVPLGNNSTVIGNLQTTSVLIHGTVRASGGFYTDSNILPTASNTYDIGSSNMPFRHGYFGTNSLYLGDYKVSKSKAQAWDAGGTNGNNASGLTNFPANVWQNPSSATNWTWTKTATEVTLTGYTGPNAVVIPDMLDGLPVTGFGQTFRTKAITSVSGGANVTSIGNYAFYNCSALTSVSLPSATSIGDQAFNGCSALTSVNLPSVTSIREAVFYNCSALTSVNLPSVTSIGDSAFWGCTALTSVSFGQNAPAEISYVYYNTPNVTNYVTNPQATGWGATWNGRPVVRLPVYADTFLGSLTLTNGTTISDGVLNGTNGIYFTPRGSTTNYWITFP